MALTGFWVARAGGADDHDYAAHSNCMNCPAFAMFFCMALAAAAAAAVVQPPAESVEWDAEGAMIRGSTQHKRVGLLFTGDQLGESTGAILDALRQRGMRAGFFVTAHQGVTKQSWFCSF